MRLWVLAHEIAGFTLFGAGHVRDALSDLVRQHAGGFRPDPSSVTDKLSSLDDESADPIAALQQALSDPELLLGAVTSPEQRELRPRLDALVAVVIGYTDWVVDAVAVRLVGGEALRIAEAVRRQRIETSANDAFVEQLLGIRIGESQVARGKAFVQGVVDRTGDDGLLPLLERPDSIPTPNEVDAPGLWLARDSTGSLNPSTGRLTPSVRGCDRCRLSGHKSGCCEVDESVHDHPIGFGRAGRPPAQTAIWAASGPHIDAETAQKDKWVAGPAPPALLS